MPLLKNGFLEKIETWHVGLSCQYTHFMSFSSKSEHDTVADQATLNVIVLIFYRDANINIQKIGRFSKLHATLLTHSLRPLLTDSNDGFPQSAVLHACLNLTGGEACVLMKQVHKSFA